MSFLYNFYYGTVLGRVKCECNVCRTDFWETRTVVDAASESNSGLICSLECLNSACAVTHNE